MKKSYVVIGMGRFGTSVAERLYELGNEVLAIDTNPVKGFSAWSPRLPVRSSPTCATKRCFVRSAREAATGAVVAIGSDLATCIIATLNLKDLGVPQVICKATDELRKKALEKVGAGPRRHPGAQRPASSWRRQSRLRVFWISSSCRRTAALPKSRRRKAGSERRCASSTSAQSTASISLPSATTEKLTSRPGADLALKEHTVLVVLGTNDKLAKLRA